MPTTVNVDQTTGIILGLLDLASKRVCKIAGGIVRLYHKDGWEQIVKYTAIRRNRRGEMEMWLRDGDDEYAIPMGFTCRGDGQYDITAQLAANSLA